MVFVSKGAGSDRHIHYLFKIDPFGMPRLGNLSKYVTRPSLVSAKKHVEKFGKYMRVNCEESKKEAAQQISMVYVTSLFIHELLRW